MFINRGWMEPRLDGVAALPFPAPVGMGLGGLGLALYRIVWRGGCAG